MDLESFKVKNRDIVISGCQPDTWVALNYLPDTWVALNYLLDTWVVLNYCT